MKITVAYQRVTWNCRQDWIVGKLMQGDIPLYVTTPRVSIRSALRTVLLNARDFLPEAPYRQLVNEGKAEWNLSFSST